jgi:hypothetical protein
MTKHLSSTTLTLGVNGLATPIAADAAMPAYPLSAGDLYLQAAPIMAAAAPVETDRQVAVAPTDITATSNLFTYTGASTTVTVTTTGIYDITVDGAQGGGSNTGGAGGDGAQVSGNVTLTAGEVLTIIVGGQGRKANSGYTGSGGGGSFVIEEGPSTAPLAIAGGGGGASPTSGGIEGQASEAGANGTGHQHGLGGVNGQGGSSTTSADTTGTNGGGGGGYLTAGGSDEGFKGGSADGGAGGAGYSGANGGFGGGGGAGEEGGGGGGGYGGGGGGGTPGTGGAGGGGGSYLEASATGTLITAGENSGNGTITIDFVTLCYLRGTNILTPTGERPIEALHIGDPVVTRFNGIQPIKWIGRQSYAPHFVANNPAKHPVQIRAGALGPNLPARDLSISPGHSMLLENTLILAESLINGITITQTPPATELAYYQIELETHDCIIAEGTFSETYADAPGLRAQFHNQAEYRALYPNEIPPTHLTLCAPRPERGPDLAAILHPIIERACANLTPGPLIGAIDRISTNGEIDGWAMDTSHPHLPITLEILIDNQVAASILACDYREDLQKAGLGQGRHAFFAKLPGPITSTNIRIRRAGDTAELRHSNALAA